MHVLIGRDKRVVWSCDPSKVAGYDGFNNKFVENMQVDIGAYISNFILQFFEHGSFLEETNKTQVMLILKVDKVEKFKDFRPISMVDCLYKIIAKILASRLKLVMPSLISESQLAFEAANTRWSSSC